MTWSFKVVVTGPVGAGKTTFVGAISDVETLSTDAAICDGTGSGTKTTTTVAIDFGRLALGDDMLLYLFGTPGQDRFDYMWEVASRGMLGYILLVDASDDASLEAAQKILRFFRNLDGDAPHVVGVNRVSDAEADCVRVRDALGLDDGTVIIPIDARERASVRDALVVLLERVILAVDAAA